MSNHQQLHLRTTIHIHATPARVWSELTDVGNYPQWNPFMTHFAGEIAVGRTVSVTAGGNNFSPTILAVRPARELRWEGKLISHRLFRGEHYFLLSARPDGTTDLEHGEYFGGLLLPLLKGKLTRQTREGFEAMNQALRVRCETTAEPA